MGPEEGLEWASERGISAYFLQVDDSQASGISAVATPEFQQRFPSAGASTPSRPACARRTAAPRLARGGRRSCCGCCWRCSAAAAADLWRGSDQGGVEKALAGEVGAELILREAMAELSELWDFILLDCPPSLGLLAVSALCAAREVLVPVEVSSMALAGLAGVIQIVDRVRDRLNPDLAVSEILVCRADARTNLSREVVERLRERFGKLVMNTAVRETVRLREAWSFAQPVTTYDPRGRGAEDYRSAAAELLERRRRT